MDRNAVAHAPDTAGARSLSARRAWIEIAAAPSAPASGSGSLSARRAWIEIRITDLSAALHCRRSPQGERG